MGAYPEALCAHGAELDARGNYQYTPLIIAAANGHPKVCAMLLALGADPSLKNQYGETALDKAGQAECVALLQQPQQQLLLQSGSDNIHCGDSAVFLEDQALKQPPAA